MFMDARNPPKHIAGYDPVATAGDCVYDTEAAEKAVQFFPRVLTFVKGLKASEPFRLEDWQADIVRTIFGWKRTDGTRRYRQVFIEVPRKNGKSTLIAGLALYVLFCDAEQGAECYCAASDKDQASLVFNSAAQMLRKSSLAKRCKVRDSVKRVIYGDSFFRAIPANEGGSHGFDSHFIVGDELHAWPGREFHDVLHTSTGARAQPLELYITTAGYDKKSVCYEKYQYSKQVRDGKIDDASFLPVIYEAEEGDDWTDPQVLAKANPNLGVSVSLEYLERECEKAKQNPAYENTFRRLHLNQWTSQETRWLQMSHWRECSVIAGELNDELPVIGGLDLSAVSDFTAWMRVQRNGEGIRCRGHYFLPEEKAEEYARKDNLPIEQWKRDGWLTLIPGRRIEHSYIHAKIKDDSLRYGVQTLGFDPWNMEQLRQDLESEGYEMVEVRQGYASLSGPAKELERQILGHTLDHGGDPVLEWMAENAVAKVDENGNVRPVKGAGKHKIDGIVALLNAIHVLQAVVPEGPSIYETPGMLSL
jgi:phage terminase large subunit-like protein